MTRRTVRLIPLLIALGVMICLALAPYALASKWAYVEPTSSGQGVQSDIFTPASALSNIPGGTTVKAAVWIRDRETYDIATDAGWLIRPGTYDNPETYYQWRSQAGSMYEEPLSPQSYGDDRVYRIYYDPTGAGSTRWSVYIVSSWRHYTYMYSTGYNYALGGGKTAADNANLWGYLTTTAYRNSGGTWVAFPSTASTHNDSPLAIGIVNSKYDFTVDNTNY